MEDILNKNFLKILKDPKSQQGVYQEGQTLFTEDKQTSFPIIMGIPTFLKDGDVNGKNAKYQKFYDKIGFFTGSVFWFLCRLFHFDMVSKRKEVLSDLDVTPGQIVLETSIGAGANIPPLTKEAEYIGVDISMGMLRACQKYSLIKPYHLQLVHANAEELPFKDETFDVVFHFGGINFFNDIPKAINEMIRVAKPGAQILIGDETQEHVDSWYSKLPFIKKYFQEVEGVSPPTNMIPSHMENLKLRYKWDKSMYVITFYKPK
ncbi:MAG: class I SAM-dependent methyltransferase [Chlamydiales bacterium]